MQKSLDQVNKYAKEKCKDKVVPLYLCLVQTHFQYSIRLVAQPAKSPDMNALNLGVWYSLAAALPALKFDTDACKKVLVSLCFTHRLISRRKIESLILWNGAGVVTVLTALIACLKARRE